jgi:hypothetical protein
MSHLAGAELPQHAPGTPRQRHSQSQGVDVTIITPTPTMKTKAPWPSSESMWRMFFWGFLFGLLWPIAVYKGRKIKKYRGQVPKDVLQAYKANKIMCVLWALALVGVGVYVGVTYGLAASGAHAWRLLAYRHHAGEARPGPDHTSWHKQLLTSGAAEHCKIAAPGLLLLLVCY